MKTKVAVVVENSQKQVLLIREKTPRYPQFGWNTIKGSVDPGESLTEAVVRECREEAGVRVELQNLIGIHEVISGEEQKLQFNYVVTTEDSGQVPDQKDQEVRDEAIEEVRWFTWEELESLAEDQMLNKRAYQVIQEYLGGKVYPLELFTQIVE